MFALLKIHMIFMIRKLKVNNYIALLTEALSNRLHRIIVAQVTLYPTRL